MYYKIAATPKPVTDQSYSLNSRAMFTGASWMASIIIAGFSLSEITLSDILWEFEHFPENILKLPTVILGSSFATGYAPSISRLLNKKLNHAQYFGNKISIMPSEDKKTGIIHVSFDGNLKESLIKIKKQLPSLSHQYDELTGHSPSKKVTSIAKWINKSPIVSISTHSEKPSLYKKPSFPVL